MALKYPSRSQSRRSQGGRGVQGSRRSVRGARRSGEARPLRSVRPRRCQRRCGRRCGFDPTIFADFSDIFSGLGDVFGFGDIFGQRRRRGGPQRGADLRYDLEISFEESATGTETTIQIPREETCETCKGSGAAEGTSRRDVQSVPRHRSASVSAGIPDRRAAVRELSRHRQDDCEAVSDLPRRGRVGRERKLTVKIPAGIATGQRLRLYGEGEHGTAGGPQGDLYVVVHVQEHSFFHREEDDLYCEMPMSFPTLALGGAVKVPTLDGREEVHVPAGTQPGARFKLRGKGMPHVNGRGHGDLYVIARVAVPKKLTKEQKHLLEELGANPAAGEAGRRRGGQRREAVLRARQRHLWLATPRSICALPRARGPWNSRSCSTPSSMRSSRSPSRNTPAEDGWRVFFRLPSHRDEAQAALASGLGHRLVGLSPIDVDDEDWARRSQAALTAITAGRITVAPPWDIPEFSVDSKSRMTGDDEAGQS